MLRSTRRAAWVAALAALWAYALTLSPTVAWVNQGEDSGDLLAASATLGIPHPTGYPLFVLLGRVAGFLPLGSLAFRVNLVAAVAGALSVYFLARFVLELSPRTEGAGAAIASGAAALTYAFSRGAWSQSVLAEVYTLNAAFLGAILWSLARAERTGSARHLALAAYLLGLGLTNHLLLLAAVAAAGVVAVRRLLRGQIGIPGLVLLLLLAVWGLTLDLYLPIRAARAPEFNWGVPASPRQLLWVLSGAQYRGNLFARGPLEALAHFVPGRWGIDFGLSLSLLALGVVGIGLGRPRGLLPAAATLAAAIALLSAYSIGDDVGYWMPVGFLACALAGVGTSALWERFPGRLPRACLAAIALIPAAAAPFHRYALVDASKDLTPYVYAHHNLEAVEPNALIVSDYDGRTFSLWFYKATDFKRSHPGLVVAYKSLLVWPWYQHHLSRRYPTLAVPAYSGDLNEFLNRLIARNIRQRPVYLVKPDPALLPIFTTEPVGDRELPLYRVRLRAP
jgi:transmembrane protein TMEM260 (protein O-mannosyltransferase)